MPCKRTSYVVQYRAGGEMRQARAVFDSEESADATAAMLRVAGFKSAHVVALGYVVKPSDQ